MEHSSLMGLVDDRRHVGHDATRIDPRQATLPGGPVGQGAAGAEFHHQERLTNGGQACLVQGHDAGMVAQSAERLRLAFEAGAVLRRGVGP